MYLALPDCTYAGTDREPDFVKLEGWDPEYVVITFRIQYMYMQQQQSSPAKYQSYTYLSFAVDSR